nr:transcription initiation factor TFIID subunit 1-like [Lytechinus pictus]
MDSEDEDGGHEFSLTGFMFGNIDRSGQLEDDVFDEDAKCHLSGLGTLSGLESMFKELTGEQRKDDDKEDDEEEDYDDDDESGSDQDSSSEKEKAVEAVDYSDITEMAEEEQVYIDTMASMSTQNKGNNFGF